ncbi:MAG: 4-hydroxy-tetrahydrodipicolinate reductase [Lachnospiraceae bacterium]|jgi:4-hydroxy-tetrahydrodipicolinate reductase|nr:4-hydroxy-tetrahydrodipicolinate reductase [Lachnospiraceae bacterium]
MADNVLDIILHGCNGQMGRTVTELLAAEPTVRIVAGIDPHDTIANTYPVYPQISAYQGQADVVIDISIAAAVSGLLDYCSERKVPCVLCTTGLSQADEEKLLVAAESTAILRSANMSLGINLLLKMVKEAAKTLAPAGFDIEIVEKHHRLKVDAPSGTALALATAINDELAGEYDFCFDRSKERKRRETKEIGFACVRGGTIVGEHDVIFAGLDEVITFSHAAHAKSIFAKGAVAAAKFLYGKPAGLYSMADVIN